jgi:hypothetical protein
MQRLGLGLSHLKKKHGFGTGCDGVFSVGVGLPLVVWVFV